jgi:methyl-accepting chemotaxis protein WspA
VNLTIKRMLIGLVATGVAVVAALAWASFYSNARLIESQDRLTQAVLHLEKANQQIREAMAAFIERQGKIQAADGVEALAELADRSPLEEAFQNSLAQVRGLLADRAEAEDLLDRIQTAYGEFLEQDAALLASREESLRVSTESAAAAERMDALRAELRKNAEAISGRVNFAAMREKIALREYFQTEDKTEELQMAVRDLVQQDLTRAQQACNDLRLGVVRLGSYGQQLQLVRSAETVTSLSENEIAEAGGLVQASLGILKTNVAESAELMALVQKVEKDFEAIAEVLGTMAALRTERLAGQARMAEIQAALQGRIAEMDNALEGLRRLSVGIREAARRNAADIREFNRFFVLIAGLAAIGFMVVIGWFTARRILGPIDKAVAFADTIAKGDLTARIDLDRNVFLSRFRLGRNDEIGKLVSKLREMAESLNALIGQVQQSGLQVNTSATELSAAAREQQATVTKQMESTKRVNHSVGEISNVSESLVDTMQQVATMSNETAEFATSGQEGLERMKSAIGHMEDASRSISGKLEVINEKATSITSVVTTITKVADQTNLLSLNAAIEAEKAGEYGRGFTVVAREIRRLADQTAVATLDIEKTVQDMQTAVSAGVMEMDAFIKEVRDSAEDVARISEQLDRIIEQVKVLSPNFDQVTQSMQSQTSRAREISRAVGQLADEMTQTAEGLKESFEAIEQLNDAARGLQDEVSRFTVA